MGCHTWFYQKVNRTLEEAKELALKKKEEWDPKVRSMLEHESTLGLHNKRSLEYHKAALDHEVQRIKDGDLVLIYEHQPESPSFYDYSNGNFYVDIKPDDLPFNRMPFRVSGPLEYIKDGKLQSRHYPEVMLASFDETVEWVDNFGTPMNFTAEGDWKELVKAFWDKYPDGLILFG